MIVINFNRREDLRNCLLSLSKQRDAAGQKLLHEVVVIDNGSSDGSSDLVQNQFPYVKLIQNTDNVGFCRANNQGFAATSAPFLALLNNDAVADPLWLAHLLRLFQTTPGLGMAASKIMALHQPTRIDKVGHILFADGQNRGRASGHLDQGQYEREEAVLWPDGCAAMYSRQMLDITGGFDEDLFAYADDAELGLRGRIAGFSSRYCPHAVVWHARGATLGRGNPHRVYLIERNRILLALKLFPKRILLLHPWFLAQRLYFSLRYLAGDAGDLEAFPGLAGKAKVAWAMLRAQWGALLLAPRFWAKRASVRAFAQLSSGELARQLRNWHREACQHVREGGQSNREGSHSTRGGSR